jgi:hypothetical protein
VTLPLKNEEADARFENAPNRGRRAEIAEFGDHRLWYVAQQPIAFLLHGKELAVAFGHSGEFGQP